MQYISEYQEDIMDLLSREKQERLKDLSEYYSLEREISFVLLWII